MSPLRIVGYGILRPRPRGGRRRDDMSAVSQPVKSPTQRSARGGRQRRLSLEMVLDGALRVIDRDGLDGLSMRRLDDELGVGDMTLYVYARTKEEVLERGITFAHRTCRVDVETEHEAAP